MDFFQIDSYSAFYGNGDISETELNDKLQVMGVDTLYIVGLALDHNVFHSAKDAKSLGYTTIVVLDATKGNDKKKNSEVIKQMKQMNISIIQSTDFVMEICHNWAPSYTK